MLKSESHSTGFAAFNRKPEKHSPFIKSISIVVSSDQLKEFQQIAGVLIS
jgi:hypothetical protein